MCVCAFTQLLVQNQGEMLKSGKPLRSELEAHPVQIFKGTFLQVVWIDRTAALPTAHAEHTPTREWSHVSITLYITV